MYDLENGMVVGAQAEWDERYGYDDNVYNDIGYQNEHVTRIMHNQLIDNVQSVSSREAEDVRREWKWLYS